MVFFLTAQKKRRNLMVLIDIQYEKIQSSIFVPPQQCSLNHGPSTSYNTFEQ